MDIDRFRAGVLGAGRSVWFLDGDPEARDDEPFRVAWGGGAIAPVGAGGRLSFPFVGPDQRAAVAVPYTVDDLRELGRRSTWRVDLGDPPRDDPPR